jgi:hypothetical protein
MEVCLNEVRVLVTILKLRYEEASVEVAKTGRVVSESEGERVEHWLYSLLSKLVGKRKLKL